jgi:hypothetical protein
VSETAARTEALLDHFNWELFDHPATNLIDCRFPTWQCCHNFEFKEGAEKGLSQEEAGFDTEIQKKVFANMISILILTVIVLRSSSSKYFLYIIKLLYSHCLF